MSKTAAYALMEAGGAQTFSPDRANQHGISDGESDEDDLPTPCLLSDSTHPMSISTGSLWHSTVEGAVVNTEAVLQYMCRFYCNDCSKDDKKRPLWYPTSFVKPRALPVQTMTPSPIPDSVKSAWDALSDRQRRFRKACMLSRDGEICLTRDGDAELATNENSAASHTMFPVFSRNIEDLPKFLLDSDGSFLFSVQSRKTSDAKRRMSSCDRTETDTDSSSDQCSLSSRSRTPDLSAPPIEVPCRGDKSAAKRCAPSLPNDDEDDEKKPEIAFQQRRLHTQLQCSAQSVGLQSRLKFHHYTGGPTIKAPKEFSGAETPPEVRQEQNIAEWKTRMSLQLASLRVCPDSTEAVFGDVGKRRDSIDSESESDAESDSSSRTTSCLNSPTDAVVMFHRSPRSDTALHNIKKKSVSAPLTIATSISTTTSPVKVTGQSIPPEQHTLPPRCPITLKEYTDAKMAQIDACPETFREMHMQKLAAAAQTVNEPPSPVNPTTYNPKVLEKLKISEIPDNVSKLPLSAPALHTSTPSSPPQTKTETLSTTSSAKSPPSGKVVSDFSTRPANETPAKSKPKSKHPKQPTGVPHQPPPLYFPNGQLVTTVGGQQLFIVNSKNLPKPDASSQSPNVASKSVISMAAQPHVLLQRANSQPMMRVRENPQQTMHQVSWNPTTPTPVSVPEQLQQTFPMPFASSSPSVPHHRLLFPQYQQQLHNLATSSSTEVMTSVPSVVTAAQNDSNSLAVEVNKSPAKKPRVRKPKSKKPPATAPEPTEVSCNSVCTAPSCTLAQCVASAAQNFQPQQAHQQAPCPQLIAFQKPLVLQYPPSSIDQSELAVPQPGPQGVVFYPNGSPKKQTNVSLPPTTSVIVNNRPIPAAKISSNVAQQTLPKIQTVSCGSGPPNSSPVVQPVTAAVNPQTVLQPVMINGQLFFAQFHQVPLDQRTNPTLLHGTTNSAMDASQASFAAQPPQQPQMIKSKKKSSKSKVKVEIDLTESAPVIESFQSEVVKSSETCENNILRQAMISNQIPTSVVTTSEVEDNQNFAQMQQNRQQMMLRHIQAQLAHQQFIQRQSHFVPKSEQIVSNDQGYEANQSHEPAVSEQHASIESIDETINAVVAYSGSPLVESVVQPVSSLHPDCTTSQDVKHEVEQAEADSTKPLFGLSADENSQTTPSVLEPYALREMKVADLKVECRRRGIPVSGPKPKLVQRLLRNMGLNPDDYPDETLQPRHSQESEQVDDPQQAYSIGYTSSSPRVSSTVETYATSPVVFTPEHPCDSDPPSISSQAVGVDIKRGPSPPLSMPRLIPELAPPKPIVTPPRRNLLDNQSNCHQPQQQHLPPPSVAMQHQRIVFEQQRQIEDLRRQVAELQQGQLKQQIQIASDNNQSRISSEVRASLSQFLRKGQIADKPRQTTKLPVSIDSVHKNCPTSLPAVGPLVQNHDGQLADVVKSPLKKKKRQRQNLDENSGSTNEISKIKRIKSYDAIPNDGSFDAAMHYQPNRLQSNLSFPGNSVIESTRTGDNFNVNEPVDLNQIRIDWSLGDFNVDGNLYSDAHIFNGMPAPPYNQCQPFSVDQGSEIYCSPDTKDISQTLKSSANDLKRLPRSSPFDKNQQSPTISSSCLPVPTLSSANLKDTMLLPEHSMLPNVALIDSLDDADDILPSELRSAPGAAYAVIDMPHFGSNSTSPLDDDDAISGNTDWLDQLISSGSDACPTPPNNSPESAAAATRPGMIDHAAQLLADIDFSDASFSMLQPDRSSDHVSKDVLIF